MAKRIIPCLDTKDGELVKGINFEGLQEVGDPVEFAQKYDNQGADELVFLDIGATPEGREIFLDLVKDISENISIPFTVGGGIRNEDDVKNVIDAGADKVSINTAAIKNPDLIDSISEKFGSESLVIAIDAKRDSEGYYEVFISGGKKPTGLKMIEWAKEVEERGAGEILYTGKHTDGTKEGYDIEGTKKLVQNLDIPVIASGGAGNLKHFEEAFVQAKASGALAASVFHYEEYTVMEVKKYLKEKGIPVKV